MKNINQNNYIFIYPKHICRSLICYYFQRASGHEIRKTPLWTQTILKTIFQKFMKTTLTSDRSHRILCPSVPFATFVDRLRTLATGAKGHKFRWSHVWRKSIYCNVDQVSSQHVTAACGPDLLKMVILCPSVRVVTNETIKKRIANETSTYLQSLGTVGLSYVSRVSRHVFQFRST